MSQTIAWNPMTKLDIPVPKDQVIKPFSLAITLKGNLQFMLAAYQEIRCLPNNLLVPYRIESRIEMVEQIVEVVEKVAEKVDKIAEDIADDLPEGKLKNMVNFVEEMSEKTAKSADSVGHFIDKVQEAEDKVESFVESLNGEPKKSPKQAKKL